MKRRSERITQRSTPIQFTRSLSAPNGIITSNELTSSEEISVSQEAVVPVDYSTNVTANIGILDRLDLDKVINLLKLANTVNNKLLTLNPVSSQKEATYSLASSQSDTDSLTRKFKRILKELQNNDDEELKELNAVYQDLLGNTLSLSVSVLSKLQHQLNEQSPKSPKRQRINHSIS